MINEYIRRQQLAGILDGPMTIIESNLPPKAFTEPHDRDPQIWIHLDRGDRGPYYVLEKDKWFRAKEGNAMGYGIMLRSFKVTGSRPEMDQYHGQNYKKIKMTCKYLPSKFVDYDDDTPSNYENTAGWLYIKNDLGIEPSDVVTFINSHMKEYTP
jgi:hypothetical protein